MNFDWLTPQPPKGRIRRFWWNHGTLIIFWLLVLVMVAMFFGATWLAFTVGVRVRFVP